MCDVAFVGDAYRLPIVDSIDDNAALIATIRVMGYNAQRGGRQVPLTSNADTWWRCIADICDQQMSVLYIVVVATNNCDHECFAFLFGMFLSAIVMHSSFLSFVMFCKMNVSLTVNVLLRVSNLLV